MCSGPFRDNSTKEQSLCKVKSLTLSRNGSSQATVTGGETYTEMFTSLQAELYVQLNALVCWEYECGLCNMAIMKQTYAYTHRCKHLSAILVQEIAHICSY